MPILIWDNGGSYSDHSIYFIDCESFDPKEVEAVTLASNRDGELIAIVREIEWRQDVGQTAGDRFALVAGDDEKLAELREQISAWTFVRLSRAELERLHKQREEQQARGWPTPHTQHRIDNLNRLLEAIG